MWGLMWERKNSPGCRASGSQEGTTSWSRHCSQTVRWGRPRLSCTSVSRERTTEIACLLRIPLCGERPDQVQNSSASGRRRGRCDDLLAGGTETVGTRHDRSHRTGAGRRPRTKADHLRSDSSGGWHRTLGGSAAGTAGCYLSDEWTPPQGCARTIARMVTRTPTAIRI